MMGTEPGRPNELSPITRIDIARVRPVQSAAGRSFVEPGSPWQNPFVESFGSRVRDEVLSVEAFDSVLEAQTVITDWRKRCSLLARKVPSKRGNFRERPFQRLSDKSDRPRSAVPKKRLRGAEHAPDRCSAPPKRGPRTPSGHLSDSVKPKFTERFFHALG